MTLNFREPSRPRRILIVEDNPGDVRLIREALRDAKILITFQVASDGIEALDILFRQGDHRNAPRPDIIMLDLNLPKKGGWEVLQEIKLDSALKSIPIIILTASEAEEDIRRSYQLHANCYITKPGNLDDFLTVVKSVDGFWLTTVKLLKNHPYA